MRLKVLAFTLVLCGAGAGAQSVDVKSVDASSSNEESTTTIEIKKRGKEKIKKSESKWEVTDGNADVEGEPAPTNKDARATWKTACDSWKKEIREDNKENKIVSISCGTASCGGDVGSKVCTSKANYKIKSRLE